MNTNSLALKVLFVVAVLIAGTLVGLVVQTGDWYQNLVKPSFNPPSWVFGPVWTILYIMIGIAGARTFFSRPRSPAAYAWGAQMILNLCWSPAFFGLHGLLLGLIVIVPMWIAILAFIVLSWRSDRTSALLFVPYLAWVSFATLLNASLYGLNT